MQAKHTQIIIAKESGSDDTYEGYEFYKGKALQSVKGRKKEFINKGKEKTIIELFDEDLAMSDELFPQAQAFYDQYASEKAIEIEDLINVNAPRLMPGAAKKKAPVTQGQLDLAKKQALAKTKVTDEDMEISF
jgi:hypothetical protein